MQQAVQDHGAWIKNQSALNEQLKKNLLTDIKNIFTSSAWHGSDEDMRHLIALRNVYEKNTHKKPDEILLALHEKALEFSDNKNKTNSPISQFSQLLENIDCTQHESLLKANDAMISLHSTLAAHTAKQLKPLHSELQSEVSSLLNHSKWKKDDKEFINALQKSYDTASKKYPNQPTKILEALKQSASENEKHAHSNAAKNLAGHLTTLDTKNKESVMDAMSDVADLHNALSEGKADNKSIGIGYRQQAR